MTTVTNKKKPQRLKSRARKPHNRAWRNDPPTATQGPNPVLIGARLRNLRKSHGKTLAELAQRVGVSVAHLSLLERDQASPNVKTLHDISHALGVSITWFFDTADRSADEVQYIVRKSSRQHIDFAGGIVDYKLTPGSVKTIGMLYSTLEPGASSGEPYTHDGEEAGLVLSGQLELVIAGKSYFLFAGDSFAFPCTLEHIYRNPSDDLTFMVAAMTPPDY